MTTPPPTGVLSLEEREHLDEVLRLEKGLELNEDVVESWWIVYLISLLPKESPFKLLLESEEIHKCQLRAVLHSESIKKAQFIAKIVSELYNQKPFPVIKFNNSTHFNFVFYTYLNRILIPHISFPQISPTHNTPLPSPSSSTSQIETAILRLVYHNLDFAFSLGFNEISQYNCPSTSITCVKLLLKGRQGVKLVPAMKKGGRNWILEGLRVMVNPNDVVLQRGAANLLQELYETPELERNELAELWRICWDLILQTTASPSTASPFLFQHQPCDVGLCTWAAIILTGYRHIFNYNPVEVVKAIRLSGLVQYLERDPEYSRSAQTNKLLSLIRADERKFYKS